MSVDEDVARSVSAEALGLAIKRLRENPDRKITQQELGDAAGYKSGAAVSISRIETGRSRPRGERLRKIAAALGVRVEELVAVAAQIEEAVSAPVGESTSEPSVGSLSYKERLVRVQQTVAERTEAATAAAESFNVAVEQAREEFFDPFCATGAKIEGAPTVSSPDGGDVKSNTDESRPTVEARDRLQHSSSVVAGALGGAGAGAALGGAAAYGAFTAAAAFGTASTGTAIGSLSGAAATNAALAFLGGGSRAAGGAGVFGGKMLLAGLVASPIAALTVHGASYMLRKNRKKQEELQRELELSEAEIVSSQRGFDAMVRLMEEATSVLDDIAVHATRAYQRWSSQLPAEPTRWEDMSDAQQGRYLEFISVAGAQLLVSSVSMSFTLLLSARGDDLDSLVEACDEQLIQARRTVDAHV